jgi:transporter family protein
MCLCHFGTEIRAADEQNGFIANLGGDGGRNTAGAGANNGYIISGHNVNSFLDVSVNTINFLIILNEQADYGQAENHHKTVSWYIGGKKMWFWLALGSAVFAALTSILAKIGIEGVGSNLATAIRTTVVLIMAWGMVFLTHQQEGIKSISQRSWIFLILSGLATGASWLCYYKALQSGSVSKVVPIDKLSVVITLVLAFVFLHEEVTLKSALGCLLIGAGTLLMVL